METASGYDGNNDRSRALSAPHLTSQSMTDLRDVKTAQGKRDKNHASVGGGMTRGELPKTLPIQVLNQGHLQERLIHTKAKIELSNAAEAHSRLSQPPQPQLQQHGSPNCNANGRGDGNGDGYDDEFPEDDAGGNSNVRFAPGRGKKSATAAARSNVQGKAGATSFEDEDGQFKNFSYDNETAKAPVLVAGKQQPQPQQSDKSMFLRTKTGEFRREHSGDHPLAPGGKGNYKKEIANGTRPAGTGGGKLTIPGNSLTPSQASAQIEKLSLAAQVKVVDPQRQLEQLRREQNEALMRVLEEEKAAEDARERMSRSILSEVEAARLELVFSEERRRASERIVRLTREHEARVKQSVLSLTTLSQSKGRAKQQEKKY